MARRFLLRVLGPFEFMLDGNAVPLPGRAKDLIALLSLQPQCRSSRSRAAGALWPEIPDDRAFANLNTTLWRLRRSLGAHYTSLIVSTRSYVRLVVDQCTVDYLELTEALVQLRHGERKADLVQHTLSICRGDLLEGQDDSEWLGDSRQQVRTMCQEALRLCGRAQISVGDDSGALGTYGRLLQIDSLDEGACRELLKIHAARGNTTEALRHYDQLCRKLRFELGIVPELATTELAEAVRLRHVGRLPESRKGRLWSGEPAMIGRSSELRHLLEALELPGRLPTVMCIEGEAGIGKTRLVQEFARTALGQGFDVLTYTCEELQESKPYAAFVGLRKMQPAAASASRSGLSTEPTPPTVLRDGSRGMTRHRSLTLESSGRALLFEETAQWLRSRVGSRSLVILEDLQYVDSASLDLLLYLLGALGEPGIVFVLTWREGSCPARLARFLQLPGRSSLPIKLGRLAGKDIRELSIEWFGTMLPHELTNLVYEKSEGNPLYAIEVLRSIDASLSPAGYSDTLKEAATSLVTRLGRISQQIVVPTAIRLSLMRRLSRLPTSARRLLNVMSACGREADIPFLCRALNVNRRDLIRGLRVLHGGGFLIETGAGYAFSHEMLRVLCYEAFPQSTRVRIHRRIARVMEKQQNRWSELLPSHVERAGWKNKAVHLWEVAGDRATSIWAHETAVSAYSRALANLEPTDQNWRRDGIRYRLLRKRATARELMGDFEESESDIARMLRVAKSHGRTSLLCDALIYQSRLMLRRGLFHGSQVVARQALDLASRSQDPLLDARGREVLALGLWRSGDVVSAGQMFEGLISKLETIGDEEALERVWGRIGSLQALQGDPRALTSLDKAEAYWTGNLNERAFRLLQKGSLLLHMSRGNESRLCLENAAADFERAGNTSGRALANALLSLVSACAGDFRGALVHAKSGLPFASARNDAYWRVISVTAICHGLLLGSGSLQLAKTMTHRVLQQLPEGTGRGKGSLLDLAATIALEERDLEAARYHVFAALDATPAGSRLSRADSLATKGRVLHASGQYEHAIESFHEAVTLFEAGANPLELTQTLSWLCACLRDADRLEEAYVVSDRAVRLLSSSGEFGYRPEEVYWNHFSVLTSVGHPTATKFLGLAYEMVRKRSRHMGKHMQERYLALAVNSLILSTWQRLLGPGALAGPPRRPIVGSKRSHAGLIQTALVVPRTGAPWGRALQLADLVEVFVTVDAGEQDALIRQGRGDVGLRRARILRMCAEANMQGGNLREQDLARALRVSARTVRGDIADLRGEGCVVSTRGSTLH